MAMNEYIDRESEDRADAMRYRRLQELEHKARAINTYSGEPALGVAETDPFDSIERSYNELERLLRRYLPYQSGSENSDSEMAHRRLAMSRMAFELARRAINEGGRHGP
jgi:hypothetical protein